MQKKFLSNLFLIVLLNLLVKPFYILGIDAEVQNRVGEEVYGNYFALLNFTFLLNILLDMGISNYNTRTISQHPQLIAKNFYKILSLRFSLFLLYASFTLMLGLVVGYSGNEFYLLCILMVNQFFVAIIQFARSNFSGLLLFKTDAFISILDRSLLIMFCSVLLWTNWLGAEFKIEWFVYAQTLAYSLTAIISIALLYSKIGQLKFDFKKSFNAAMIKQSAPYALLILLMMMYSRMDAVMLERLLPNGDAQAGIYAQGYRYLDAVNMFALLFAGLLLPIFAQLIRKKESVEEMLNTSFRILVGASCIVALTAFLFKHELLALRYTNVTEVSATTFGYLILSFIPISITYIFGTLLTANGSLKKLNWMAFAGLILNLILNFIFIHLWQAEGAAIVTLITQSAMAVVQILLVYNEFKMKVNLKLYTSFLALIILMMAIYFALNQFSQLPQIASLLILFSAGIVAAVILKLFRLSDIKIVLKKEAE